MSSDREFVEVTLHHLEAFDTAMAWCVSETGDLDDAVFLPKSKVERTERASRTDKSVWIFEMPEWLASKENFI